MCERVSLRVVSVCECPVGLGPLSYIKGGARPKGGSEIIYLITRYKVNEVFHTEPDSEDCVIGGRCVASRLRPGESCSVHP